MISLSQSWGLAFTPADRRSIQLWGGEFVELPPVLTVHGKFSTAGSRQFDAPLDALRSDFVREVNVIAPVRGGKTLIADVSAPWAIVNDNASVLWIFQDQTIAEAHAETRQTPILLGVPAIKAMLSLDRHKTRKADILFANGLPFIMRGPSMGGLQSRGFKWVIIDEAWLLKAGVLGQAKSRMGDFVKIASNKFLVISQGGEEDSDWDFQLRSGVLFVWKVPCAACAKMIAPEWTIKNLDNTFAGAVFDTVKNQDGSYDKDACAATVRFVCPHCRHEHPNSERTRAAWNIGGDYFNASTGERWSKDKIPPEVSFRWHALIDYPWAALDKEWLTAQEAKHVGNFAPLINFFQKRCALMRSERSAHDLDLPFARAPIVFNSDKGEKTWPDEVDRFLTADRQSEDTYWVMVRAWAKSGESRRLYYGKVYSEAAIEAKRVEFGVRSNCVVVDSGYRPKGDTGVYAACIRYGWIAVKGTDEPYFWHSVPQPPPVPPIRVMRPWAPLSYGDPGEGTSNEGKTRAPLIRFSAPALASTVLALINRGLWVEPETTESDTMDAECRRQMSAEFQRPKINKFSGKREMVWVCPTGNNHAFDCAKEQVLCAMQTELLPAGFEMAAAENNSPNDNTDQKPNT